MNDQALPPIEFISASAWEPNALVHVEWSHRTLTAYDGAFAHRWQYAVATSAPLGAIAEAIPSSLMRSFEKPSFRAELRQLPTGALLYVHREQNQNEVRVAARTEAEVQGIVEHIKRCWPEMVAAEHTAPVTFWFNTAQGPRTYVRFLNTIPFDGARENYTAKVLSALDALMLRQEMPSSGRFIFWHGDPGTGKTSAILSLIKEWAPWAAPHYILDPERFFGDAGYMLAVIGEQVGVDGPVRSVASDGSTRPNAKVLIIEDADEFISTDAKDRSGQALSRLLNLTDGLIGRGLHTLVLLTTNEPVTKIHPAITRAGRCLADIHFTPLTATESTRWMRNRGGAAGAKAPMTLADLYESLAQAQVVRSKPTLVPAGFQVPA